MNNVFVFSLSQLAFLRFHVIDVASNTVTAQRVVPVGRLRPGYRHLRLHNEQDQPLPLSQLFICSQIDSDVYSDGKKSLNKVDQSLTGYVLLNTVKSFGNI
jgi:hypothetical protein